MRRSLARRVALCVVAVTGAAAAIGPAPEPPPCDPAAWGALLRSHAARYPAFEIADAYKLLHQATLGAEHAAPPADAALRYLEAEVAAMGSGPVEPAVDTLGAPGRFARVHLRSFLAAGGSAPVLARAFAATPRTAPADTAAMRCAMAAWRAAAARRDVPWTEDAVTAYVAARERDGWPAVHHSTAYRATARPAYRVVALTLLGALD